MLTQLKNKINRLIALYETAIEQRDKAIQEKEAFGAILEGTEKKVKELEKRIEKLQLTNAFKTSSVDEQAAKQKIGRIVREIDTCIAMLNNQ